MKRIISLLLAFVLVLSALALVSCDKEETTEKSETGDKTKPTGTFISGVEGDIFAEHAAIDDELPDYDFGGKALRIACHDEFTIFPAAEKNTGNLIADATHSRNDTVMNRFNMKMEIAYKGMYYEVTEWVSKNVLSGADEFDLFSSHGASAGGLVLKNVFLNWYDIPNVNFSKPWWNPSCKDELTYDGKCILAVSEFTFGATSGTYCMVFNKALANAYDFGNLYEVVLNGDWTFDYFYDLIKDIYVDNDSSGDKNDGDFYGFYQGHTANMWLWAFDNPSTAKNEDGTPTIAIKTDKINNIVTMIYDLCNNTNGVYQKVGTLSQDITWDPFTSRNAIIAMTILSAPLSEGLRNFEDDYGLLPIPKFDENQKEYLSMSGGEHSVLAIPKTCKDTEFVGACIEALSAEAYKQVLPTFYEIALKTRYLRDNESKAVLDLILDGRVIDFGFIYGGFQGFSDALGDVVQRGTSNFESYYQSRYPAARTHLKKIIKIFDKLD